MIIGAGFEPKRSVPLGIYLGTTPGRLILSKIATTDAQGNFGVSARIEPSDPTGFYRVLVVTTDPDGGHCFVEDALNVTECYSGPTACFQVQ
jgi:uncharacterized protein YfaS (alpha-2-macroglobulin family)